VLAGEREERVFQAGLVHPQLVGHDLVAGQQEVTAFSALSFPVTTTTSPLRMTWLTSGR
jgi:hypothetical protein